MSIYIPDTSQRGFCNLRSFNRHDKMTFDISSSEHDLRHIPVLEKLQGSGNRREMSRLWCVAILGAALLRSSDAFLPSYPSAIQPQARTGLSLRRGKMLLRKQAVSPPRLRMTEGEGLSESDMAGLFKRVAQAKDSVSEMPCVILDAILPRQRLSFETADPIFRKLVDNASARAEGLGLGSFGMLGVDVQRQSMMRCGTEVHTSQPLNLNPKT